MENARYTMRHETSKSGSEPSTNQRQASYATERARVLFACYRRGDANDPDGYVAAIAAVLSIYEPDLIREVTDPRTGISTHERWQTFMPQSGELKAYCDEVAARRARFARYAALPPARTRALPPPSNVPGRRANLLVRADRPGYAEMLKKAETGDPADYRFADGGIWVPLDWYQADMGAVMNGRIIQDWEPLQSEAAE